MSQAGFAINSGVVALAAATAKTVLNAIAAANAPIKLTELEISFDGVSSTGVPALVELCRSTEAGAGTPGSSPTPTQIYGTTRSPQVTAGVAYSSEPTVLSVLRAWYVPVFMGLYSKQLPLGREAESLISGTTEGLAVRVTAPAIVNCRVNAVVEEGVGAGFAVNSATIALVAATPKVVCSVIAAANSPIRVVQFQISFDGTSPTGTPARVQLMWSDQSSAGTAGSSPTPIQVYGRTRTPQMAGALDYSADPGTLIGLAEWYVPVFNGSLTVQFPLGREFETPPSSSTEALCLRVTAPANVNCRAGMVAEEG